jgi:uncharacterized membrane protein HdeD (DUF308 family)
MIVVVGTWRGVALRAVIALLFGIVTLVWPELTLWALVALFGAFALVDGVFALVAAFTDDRSGARVGFRATRRWMIVEGILGILVGIVTFIWPDVTALALLYLIAAWALVTGSLKVAAGISLREEIEGEWVLVLSGALSIALAIFLVITPGTGALVITWAIGWFAVIVGALLLALALRLRSVERQLDERTRTLRHAAA